MPICFRRWAVTVLSRPGKVGWTCFPCPGPKLHLIHTASGDYAGRRSNASNASNRSLKRSRPSPSEVLVSTLQRYGRYELIWQPRPNSKINLSYASPWTSKSVKYMRRIAPRPPRHSSSVSLSLTSLVAHAIECRLLQGDVKMPVEFTERALKYLRARKYESEDVEDWASILLNRDAKAAARAFCQRDRNALNATEPVATPIPTSVFLIFLRTPLKAFDAETLRFALIHAWHELNRKWAWEKRLKDFGITTEVYNAYQLQYPTMDDSSVMIMIVRLLRHARHAWPEALVTIANMFTTNFNLPHFKESNVLPNINLRRKVVQTRLVAMYNRMLKLISLPASASPYLSVPYYRLAQFNILKKMADSKPTLPINREGYRSVISVHLASSKTDQEREWDDLKARSWPPWKEERTGLDAAKGADYGLSKALKALRQAANAGFGASVWEKVTQILSGWDIDGSPTIQTRAFQLHDGVSGSAVLQEFDRLDGGIDSISEVWAARIRATRTVQEAWACFVAYKDLNQKDGEFKSATKVYGAMLEKLAAKLVYIGDDFFDGTIANRSLSAGDGKEVFPTPESPKEITYVREPPPSFEELVDDMFTRKICPDTQTLALIISNSPSFEQTLDYLTQAAQYNTHLSSLLLPVPGANDGLQSVSSPVLTAFLVSLLSLPRITDLRSKFPAWHGIKPLAVALGFIKDYKRASCFHYYIVMNILIINQRPTGPHEKRLHIAKRALKRYAMLRDVVDSMHMRGITSDLEGFRIECKGLQYAIFSAFEVSKNSSIKKESEAYHTAQWVLHSSSSETHARFMQLMTGSEASHGVPQVKVTSMRDLSLAPGAKDASIDLPRLLAAPSPAVLHLYVRVLGLLGDFANLLAFVRWMLIYAEEITAVAQEQENGMRMLRKCIIALRVFTEGSWERKEDISSGDAVHSPSGHMRSQKGYHYPPPSAAPIIVLRLIRIGVDKLEFGGWPSVEEVKHYLKHDYAPSEDEGSTYQEFQ